MEQTFTIGRGTTQYCSIEVDGVNLSDITVLWLTFKQGDYEITKTLSDVSISADTITVHFTQEETLGFNSRARVSIQMRYMIGQEAYRSDIITASIADVIKEGIIS